jgi:3-phosphoglycerate kinase
VSTKLPVIKGLLKQVDMLILGGGLAFTFIKAKGIPVGNSLVEDSMIDTAKEILEYAEEHGKTLVIPVDAVCGTSFPSGPVDKKDTKIFDLNSSGGIEEGWSGFDIGPKSVDNIRASLDGVKKIIFNGPMGVFEIAPYDEGTIGLVEAIEECTKKGAISVVGGGDSVAALEQFNKTSAVSYVSTGGGATLELLAGDELPGVTAITDIEAEADTRGLGDEAHGSATLEDSITGCCSIQ